MACKVVTAYFIRNGAADIALMLDAAPGPVIVKPRLHLDYSPALFQCAGFEIKLATAAELESCSCQSCTAF